MLRNERYIGDALLQKTYVVDCLIKETRKNNGEIPQYYVTGNHEPIISQEEIARRSGKRKVAKKSVKTEKGKMVIPFTQPGPKSENRTVALIN